MWMFHFVSAAFPYYAEIVNDLTATNGRELLIYHEKKYVKHRMSKKNTYWRCPQHYLGCRARIKSAIIGGYVMVNKLDTDIIHTNHPAKMQRKRKIKKISI